VTADAAHAGQPGSGAQAVVDQLAEQISRPVVLDDGALRLLAYSRQDASVDAARTRTIMLRATDPDTARAVLSVGIATARGPLRTPAVPELGMDERVCVPVRASGRTIGYLWVIDAEDDLGQPEVNAMARAAQHLRFVLGPSSSDVLGDVLTRGEALRAALDAPELAAEIVPAGATATALVVDGVEVSGSVAAHDDDLMIVQSRLAAARGGTWWAFCLDGTRLIALAVTKAGDPAPDQLADQVWQALAELRTPSTRIGVARCSNANVSDGALRASRALWVADVVGSASRTVHWEELGAWRLLAESLSQSGTAERLAADLPAGMQRLVVSDCGDDLLPTLRAYLGHGGDVRVCASALHVHRSTLYYRLQRLSEVLGCDLRDGLVRFELMLGLCVLDARRQQLSTTTFPSPAPALRSGSAAS
jgi:hypothetical protein